MSREVETWLGSTRATIDLIPLPLPHEVRVGGTRIPASYANFIFTNEHLIIPQFGDKLADEQAIGILKERVCDREVIGLPSANLTYGLGSFHCLTQQEPESADENNNGRDLD